MKTLYIMRHGKSSWTTGAENDFERPLNPRGKEDVPRMGDALHQRAAHPELILCSPANRATTTALLLFSSVNFPLCRIRQSELLYMASLKILTAIISDLDNEHNEVLLVGHNPGLTRLINHFLGQRLDNLPTAGIMGLRAEVDDWHAFVPGIAEELFYISPKTI
ncbi:MAG TPA: histidine phosphatase family protein [Caldithrix abyssi]|uniref:Histidine phosphatase family protein n=1 Tax=Caldithrix abyssi TaxID=187145 RepID=A0A7V5RQ23_CALAY|nr:histidine phosphatase family protein [Caldithrix abyssi]